MIAISSPVCGSVQPQLSEASYVEPSSAMGTKLSRSTLLQSYPAALPFTQGDFERNLRLIGHSDASTHSLCWRIFSSMFCCHTLPQGTAGNGGGVNSEGRGSTRALRARTREQATAGSHCRKIMSSASFRTRNNFSRHCTKQHRAQGCAAERARGESDWCRNSRLSCACASPPGGTTRRSAVGRWTGCGLKKPGQVPLVMLQRARVGGGKAVPTTMESAAPNVHVDAVTRRARRTCKAAAPSLLLTRARGAAGKLRGRRQEKERELELAFAVKRVRALFRVVDRVGEVVCAVVARRNDASNQAQDCNNGGSRHLEECRKRCGRLEAAHSICQSELKLLIQGGCTHRVTTTPRRAPTLV